MDDLISRQAAIDALHMHLMYRMGTDSNKKRLDDWINSLPSAQPELPIKEKCCYCPHCTNCDVNDDLTINQPEPCEDAVSRKAVEEMLKNGLPKRGMWEIEGDVVKQTVCETLADALMDLEKLPSAQPKILACGNGELNAQPEPQWIPVSERLPETEEFVLASLTGKYRNTTFEHACEIADYADGGWCVYAYPHMSAEKCEELIEAWMPLPKPFEGGTE